MNNNIELAIIVKNKTRLEQLVTKFNTQLQAKFYLKQSVDNFYLQNPKLGKQKKKQKQTETDFSIYEREDEQFHQVFNQVKKITSKHLKVKVLEHEYLPSFLFNKKQLIIVVGQDGLVANTAKYVDGIPIIAINPAPERFDGILLPFSIKDFESAVIQVLNENFRHTAVSLAAVKLNDGQRLLAFNDLFIGPSKHSSARYNISFRRQSEDQSSSGIIVSTGAGSTGWLSSLFNMANGINSTFGTGMQAKYRHIPMDSNELVFIVREPFLSKTSQINLAAGLIRKNEELILESYMPHNGIIFSDGLQSDFLKFNSGTIARIGLAPEKAILVGK